MPHKRICRHRSERWRHLNYLSTKIIRQTTVYMVCRKEANHANE
nr:MAG TPA: hypothetical protein [Caudoviricetes sp.]